MILLLIVIAVIFLIGAGAKQNKDKGGKTRKQSMDDERQNLIIPTGGIPSRMLPVGRITVAGPYYHDREITTVIGNRMGEVMPAGQWDRTLELDAEVRRQPNNTHDRNAVVVTINGLIVGYIPSEKTNEWQQFLQPLESRGMFAVAKAAVYFKNDGGYLLILKADPSAPPTKNTFPGVGILDADWLIAVNGEENAQEILAKYGDESWVWATLDTGTIPKGKYKDAPTIWASVDGESVGYISATQSERYFIYVKRRLPCSCLAHIKQGPKKFELELMLPSRK
ncbi:HIRAN domain-containing protein [Bifidobacterium mongoliense]|uniref:TM2 domain-containing protein n=1 Tax=Bifidobacterium mongoliense DSM 21395 TaxID=1437603 RepID=A0A087BZX5_9BIFI|nr:HIRAN domain-containing protein [Bifidobacterium mongoliense]KFI76575.1 TM2 domain-containing protein [Bifidobacterium mongoliense DSM 21395]